MLLANRHDWLSSFASEVGVALTLEQALGITPPERATWIRTLLVEASRIGATLAFLAPVAGEVRGGLEACASATSLQEQVTGGRVHPGFARIGGVAAPIDADEPRRLLRGRRPWASAAAHRRRPCGAYAEPLAGVAVLSRDGGDRRGGERDGRRARAGWSSTCAATIRDWRTGALAETCGVVTRQSGDVPARYACCVDQLPVSSAP